MYGTVKKIWSLKYDFGSGLESPSARIMPGRSGFPVKIKEGGEAKERERERGKKSKVKEKRRRKG